MEVEPTGEDRALTYAPEISAFLRGSRFLVMGFDDPDFYRIAGILSSTGAIAAAATSRPRRSDSCHAELASISALAKLHPRPADSPPLLIVGSPNEIAEGIVGQPITGVDFLMTPWTPPELIVRAYRLVASSPRAQAKAEGSERPSILIADDDPDMANLLKLTLHSHADCKVVSNGLATVQMVRRSPPDALILDVNMPILSGFEVLKTIRQDPGLRRLPVILVTASDDVADIRRGMELGADDYIVKPFGVNALVQRIRRVLNGSMAPRATVEPQ